MRNNELLPYDTIVQATSGEPEAVNTVLQYYGRRIRYASRQASLAEALAESSGVESPYSLFQKAESKDVIP